MEDLGGGRPGTLVIPQRNSYIERTAAELKYECAIIGCSRWYNDNCNNIRFFPVPTDNEKWNLAFAHYAVEFRYQKNPRICSLHFLPEDISEQGLLSENAVPKLCLKRPGASFLSKVVLEWILRHQYYQHISRKHIFSIVEEVRWHIDANFVRMPKWITNFKYQPIKRDPSSGILRKSRPFTESGVTNIIRGLRFAQRQEEITPQLYTMRRRRAVTKQADQKKRKVITQPKNETVKDVSEDSWDGFPEIPFECIDGTEEKEEITHEEDDLNDPLETVEEVLECLRLVEGYALFAEDLKAIGIITDIKTLLSSDKDS